MKKLIESEDDIGKSIIIANKYKLLDESYFLLNGAVNLMPFFILETVRDFFKMNLGASFLTGPILLINFFIMNHKDNKHITKKIKVCRKKIKGLLEALNNEGLSLHYTDIVCASLYKDFKKLNCIKIHVLDESYKKLYILEQNVTLDNNGKRKYEVYLLDDEEKEKYINNRQVYKDKYKSIPGTIKLSKKSKTTIILYLAYLVLLLGSKAFTSFKLNKTIDNTGKVLDYYDDRSSLDEYDLDQLLKGIEKDSLKLTGDDKFDINTITTEEEQDNYLLLNAVKDNPNANKQEKEVMYNYIDFINDNPYLDYEKVYYNLVSLDFDRTYFPFSKGHKNDDGTYTSAIYYDDTIYYYTNPTESTIINQVAYAIFDTKTFPTAYEKGFAEIIENEYFTTEEDVYYSTYDKNVAVTKITMDLIGKDKFLEAVSKDDISLIKDTLINVYVTNNAVTLETATSQVETLFEYLKTDLNNYDDTKGIGDVLVSFYNNGIYDIDTFDRLFSYTDVLYSLNPDFTKDYYYFNEDKVKSLSLND